MLKQFTTAVTENTEEAQRKAGTRTLLKFEQAEYRIGARRVRGQCALPWLQITTTKVMMIEPMTPYSKPFVYKFHEDSFS